MLFTLTAVLVIVSAISSSIEGKDRCLLDRIPGQKLFCMGAQGNVLSVGPNDGCLKTQTCDHFVSGYPAVVNSPYSGYTFNMYTKKYKGLSRENSGEHEDLLSDMLFFFSKNPPEAFIHYEKNRINVTGHIFSKGFIEGIYPDSSRKVRLRQKTLYQEQLGSEVIYVGSFADSSSPDNTAATEVAWIGGVEKIKYVFRISPKLNYEKSEQIDILKDILYPVFIPIERLYNKSLANPYQLSALATIVTTKTPCLLFEKNIKCQKKILDQKHLDVSDVTVIPPKDLDASDVTVISPKDSNDATRLKLPEDQTLSSSGDTMQTSSPPSFKHLSLFWIQVIVIIVVLIIVALVIFLCHQKLRRVPSVIDLKNSNQRSSMLSANDYGVKSTSFDTRSTMSTT